MELDILELIDIEESELSKSALSIARDTQEKKNELAVRLEEDKQKVYYDLLKQGILRSSMLTDAQAELQSVYDAEVAALADDLLFRIEYLEGGDGSNTEYSYPDNPDYSLDASERYYVVRDYYMAMTDAKVRYALFQADPIAADYLGQFYNTLYERLRSYAEYE